MSVQMVDNWRLGRLLGEGYFGRTYVAEDATGRVRTPIAMKLVPLEGAQRFDRSVVNKEIDQLWSVSHENVVAVRADPREVSIDGRAYMAFGVELCDASLEQVVNNVTDRDLLLRWAIPQILEGLEYLHVRARRVHRDLHPGNILVRDATWKVSDLGLARLVDANGVYPGGPAGSIPYVAPEVARGGNADRHADTYAVGVLVHFLLTGQYLVDRPHDLRVIAKESPAIDDKLPGEWRAFVDACIQPADHRPDEATLRTLVPPTTTSFIPADLGSIFGRVMVAFDESRLIGATLYKISAAGFHHRVVLRGDRTLVESPLFDPLHSWNGKWSVGSDGALLISVNGYDLRVNRRWKDGLPVYVGHESTDHEDGSTEFRLLANAGQRTRPPGGWLKVADHGSCWFERLNAPSAAGGGEAVEYPLFDVGSWSGGYRLVRDERSADQLLLAFGPYLLAAHEVGSEWEGYELELPELADLSSVLGDGMPAAPSTARFVLAAVREVAGGD